MKLDGVHPDLIGKWEKIRTAAGVLGLTIIPTSGLRSLAEQQALYAQGRTAPGPIVTYADGVKKRSNHQAHPDGWGHALDFCFLLDGKPSWNLALPWKLIGEMAKSLGLKWGGDWKRPDRPHIELA